MGIRSTWPSVVASAAILCGAASAPVTAGNITVSFDPASFSDPLTIDNPLWPLVPGTKFLYRAETREGCELTSVEVTDQTKSVAGITAREVWDKAYVDLDCDGVGDYLAEETFDWYAQDDGGNIWYLGEDTKEYCDPPDQDTVCRTEGSWEAGIDGAVPGIIMLALPHPGDLYRQEYYAGEAEDMAKVLRINARVVLTMENGIEPDEYEGCVKTKEWTPLQPGTLEHKYYCAGVGLVLIEELKGKTVWVELVDIQ